MLIQTELQVIIAIEQNKEGKALKSFYHIEEQQQNLLERRRGGNRKGKQKPFIS